MRNVRLTLHTNEQATRATSCPDGSQPVGDNVDSVDMTHDAYVTIGWDECLYVRCEVCGTVFGPTDDEFLANRTAIDHEKNPSLSTPPPAVHVCMVTAIYEDGGSGNRGLFRVWCENCLATSPGTYDREEAERLDEAHRIDPVAHPIAQPVDGIPLDRLSQDRPFNDRPQPAKGVAVEHSDS